MHYLKQQTLEVQIMSRGMAWLDAGTFESLLDASQFIATIQKRQGLKIACVEEIAYQMGYIDAKALQHLAESHPNTPYSSYLLDLL
jgi:glucose-1-phosphate thymidylyltransferase